MDYSEVRLWSEDRKQMIPVCIHRSMNKDRTSRVDIIDKCGVVYLNSFRNTMFNSCQKDITGNNIFTLDIIEVDTGEESFISLVDSWNIVAGIDMKLDHMMEEYPNWTIKILGNIFENPELIDN